jgi:proteasome lid subunit RPN8/RPN11
MVSASNSISPALGDLLGSMTLEDLYSLVPNLEVYPKGYWTDDFGGVLIPRPNPSETIEVLDMAAYDSSTAKAAGIKWDNYHALVQEIRTRENFSFQEAANSDGGYGGGFGGDDELGHIGDDWGYLAQRDRQQNYAPVSPGSTINSLLQLYPNQFSNGTDALNALQSGGFFRQTVTGSISPDGTLVATANVNWIPLGATNRETAAGLYGGNGANQASTLPGGINGSPYATSTNLLNDAMQQKSPLDVATHLAEALSDASARDANGFGHEYTGAILRGPDGKLYKSAIFKGPRVGPGVTASITLPIADIIRDNPGMQLLATWHTHTNGAANMSDADRTTFNALVAANPTYQGEVIAAKGDTTQTFTRPGS